MSEVAQSKIEAQAPQAQLIQMATGHWVSSLVYFAAQMKLADQLAEGSKTADELALSIRADTPSLYRVMRTLCGMGLFTEDTSHRFSLAPLGEALRTGTPGSVRSSVLILAGELNTKSVGQLQYSVQTGKTGFEKAFGMPLFEWLGNHPAEASMFSETMVGLHAGEPAAVAAAYDFSQCETLIDLGGATGNPKSGSSSLSPRSYEVVFQSLGASIRVHAAAIRRGGARS